MFGFVSAYVVCYVVHEWGHLIGARASGGNMPLNALNTPLIGQFDTAAHTRAQFVALSVGGVLGYVATALVFVLAWRQFGPGWLGAGLATGGAAFVVQSLAVDVPQILRVYRGADPTTTNREGATPAIIIKRTWQTWLPLAAAIAVWNLVR